MALFWQVVTLLSVWLLYGFAASLFVKGSNKRDYLLLISSGLLGGLIGGRIGNILDVPEKYMVVKRSNQTWYSNFIYAHASKYI